MDLLARIKEKQEELGFKFDVIIVDPIYKFFVGGDINGTTDSTTFADNIDYLLSEIKATIIEVHHDSEKTGVGKQGQVYDKASPEQTFGNTFLAGNVTHVTTLKSYGTGKKKKYKLLTPTERSGGMVKDLTLRMVIPQVEIGKLGFIPNDGCDSATKLKIRIYLEENGEATQAQICHEEEIADGTFTYAMKGNTKKDYDKSMMGMGIVKARKVRGHGNTLWYSLTGKTVVNDAVETVDKMSKVQKEIGYGQ